MSFKRPDLIHFERKMKQTVHLFSKEEREGINLKELDPSPNKNEEEERKPNDQLPKQKPSKISNIPVMPVGWKPGDKIPMEAMQQLMKTMKRHELKKIMSSNRNAG